MILQHAWGYPGKGAPQLEDQARDTQGKMMAKRQQLEGVRHSPLRGKCGYSKYCMLWSWVICSVLLSDVKVIMSGFKDVQVKTLYKVGNSI